MLFDSCPLEQGAPLNAHAVLDHYVGADSHVGADTTVGTDLCAGMLKQKKCGFTLGSCSSFFNLHDVSAVIECWPSLLCIRAVMSRSHRRNTKKLFVFLYIKPVTVVRVLPLDCGALGLMGLPH